MTEDNRMESLKKYRQWQKRQAEEELEKSRRLLESARQTLLETEGDREKSLIALEEQPDSLSWKEICYLYLDVLDKRMENVRQELSGLQRSFEERRAIWTAAWNEMKKIEILIENEQKNRDRVSLYHEERRMDDALSGRRGTSRETGP